MSPEGLLNIDKPLGVTSHDVVRRIRQMSGTRRVGHAGTLDPLATGVLLVCVGRATRLVEYLIGHSKRYEATIRLGQTTNTYDAEGEIVDESPVQVTLGDIAKVLPSFLGRSQQRAPIYSAIKREGQPLYKLARAGKTVEAPLREVEIFDLELLAWDLPDLSLAVHCSSGTYIRSLAHDLGQCLGTGGHLVALRRLAVDEFTSAQAVNLSALDASNWTAYLQPSDTAVRHLPRVEFPGRALARLQMGQQIPLEAPWSGGETARAYGPDKRFAGIVVVRDKMWQPHKMFL